MAQLNPKEMQQALAKPFAPEDLEWRLQNTTEEKMRGLAVPYVTNRAIQNRLDEVCGPENWYNDFKPWHSNGKKEAQLCGIAIYFEGRGFITKWDGAEDSDIESVKGGLSDSMKRAAVQWGIGRVLYDLTFAQFKEDDLGKWAAEAAEMEQRCASLAEQASAETERLRAEIQTLTADLEYGNLSQSEYDHLGTCREELRQSEAKIAALQTMTAAQLPDFDREIAQANASIAEIKRKMANVIAYISKRAELTFSQLKMNRVEISLYDVVKSTGEVKDTFKFQYSGRRYDRLSLSEKIRAGMEVSELMKRLTGRNYPVFVDNMESVDDLANVRPTGQIIMAKCVSGAALQVKPVRPIVFAEQRAA